MRINSFDHAGRLRFSPGRPGESIPYFAACAQPLYSLSPRRNSAVMVNSMSDIPSLHSPGRTFSEKSCSSLRPEISRPPPVTSVRTPRNCRPAWLSGVVNINASPSTCTPQNGSVPTARSVCGAADPTVSLSLTGIGSSTEAAGTTTGCGALLVAPSGAEHPASNSAIDAIANFMASPWLPECTRVCSTPCKRMMTVSQQRPAALPVPRHQTRPVNALPY